MADYLPRPEMTHAYIITSQTQQTAGVSLAANQGGGFAQSDLRAI